MIPIVFINCATTPYIDDIMLQRKTCETRTRNTLRALVGSRVLLAETGTRSDGPLVRCSARIVSAVPVYTRSAWSAFRPLHRVPAGSAYDWTDTTRVKWLYQLSDVQPVAPFTAPPGTRHGRVWMEYNAI